MSSYLELLPIEKPVYPELRTESFRVYPEKHKPLCEKENLISSDDDPDDGGDKKGYIPCEAKRRSSRQKLLPPLRWWDEGGGVPKDQGWWTPAGAGITVALSAELEMERSSHQTSGKRGGGDVLWLPTPFSPQICWPTVADLESENGSLPGQPHSTEQRVGLVESQ